VEGFQGLQSLTKDVLEKVPLSSHNYAAVFRTLSEQEKLYGMEELCSSIRQRCAGAVCSEWQTGGVFYTL
jgi:hypothetical protein